MLSELHISNVAIIDELRIQFGDGLHILSGETGAGKSIILDALGLILGGRGDVGMIREGEPEATVEAHFFLEDAPWMAEALREAGLPEETELVVRRVLSRTGRNRVHVNGNAVTLASLKTLAQGLVDFSSQHEQQILLDPARHLDILDDFGGHAGQREEMRAASDRLTSIIEALAALDKRAADRTEREAFLRFQLEELQRVNPLAGEEEELEVERKRLAHSEKLRTHAEGAEALLYSAEGAVVDQLGEALRLARAIAEIDPSMSDVVAVLESSLVQVEDGARSMASYARAIEANPERLDEIGARLNALAALKRKYRMGLDELAERRGQMAAELRSLENFEEERGHLEADRKAAHKAAAALAEQLSAARKKVARTLELAVQAELASLNMAAARFEVRVSAAGASAAEIGPKGWDRVDFYLAANPGEPARPISKVASGGELSRILLALKCALAGAGDVGTFIFDEIDTGIGGATAEVVGQKLKRISEQRQVISITHLPQIAAYGQHHFNVVKEIVGDRTLTRVEPLDTERRVEELARMLGGLRITKTTREHAQELIERGQGLP